jgi:hypothetical protein
VVRDEASVTKSLDKRVGWHRSREEISLGAWTTQYVQFVTLFLKLDTFRNDFHFEGTSELDHHLRELAAAAR